MLENFESAGRRWNRDGTEPAAEGVKRQRNDNVLKRKCYTGFLRKLQKSVIECSESCGECVRTLPHHVSETHPADADSSRGGSRLHHFAALTRYIDGNEVEPDEEPFAALHLKNNG